MYVCRTHIIIAYLVAHKPLCSCVCVRCTSFVIFQHMDAYGQSVGAQTQKSHNPLSSVRAPRPPLCLRHKQSTFRRYADNFYEFFVSQVRDITICNAIPPNYVPLLRTRSICIVVVSKVTYFCCMVFCFGSCLAVL